MEAVESPQFGKTAILIVLVAAFLCFFMPFDQPGFAQNDELFYLVGGMTANETGDFLVPSYQGHVRFQKPPLNYWLISASYRLFGVGAWQGRFPSVLASVASIWLTWRLGILLFASRRSGLYAACALASCHLVIDQAHLATTDSVLALFVLGAFFGFSSAIRDRSRWGLPLAWGSMGAAMLQKGPVWALIPLATVMFWMFLAGRRTGVTWRQVFSPLSVLLFCAVVVPWPILVMRRLAESAVLPTVSDELRKHLVPSPMEWPEGLLSALARVFFGFLPWSILCLHYRERETRTPAVSLLGLWGLGVGLLFGVIMVLHRSRYFVPLAPAIALLCGHALAELQQDTGRNARLGKFFSVLVDLSFLAAALVSVSLISASLALVRTTVSNAIAIAGIVVAAAAFFVVRRLRGREPGGFRWVVAATAALAVVQVLIQFSWPGSYFAGPAYGLMKQYVRGLPATAAVAGVGLGGGQRSWAWLGAGHSFPHFGKPGAPETAAAWPEIAKHRFLLVPSDQLDAIPEEVRAGYTQRASLTGSTLLLQPFWFLDRTRFTEEWRPSQRTLVLLQRTP